MSSYLFQAEDGIRKLVRARGLGDVYKRQVAVVETAIEKGAASILMPISSRRQLNDLPDDLAAKITIHYYLDARDALLKALAI